MQGCELCMVSVTVGGSEGEREQRVKRETRGGERGIVNVLKRDGEDCLLIRNKREAR